MRAAKPANLIFISLLLTLLISCAGCMEPADKPSSADTGFCTIEDDAGRNVLLAKKPERIAVTSVSFLEPLHEVGGDVVGRPDSRNKMPDYAKDKPSIGQVYQIDVERLLACQPDLVIINKGMNEKLLEVLESNGIPAIVVNMKSYKDVKNEITIFSHIAGNTAKGEQLIAGMDQRIQGTIAKLPKEKKRVAVLHSTAQGLSVQLDGSIAGNIVRLLGWENVASGMTPMEKNPDAAPYSMETLVEQNPEIIFITSMGKIEDIKANMDKMINDNPAWQTIPAVKNGQIYYLPQDLFLLSPGIHYPEAVELMARLIYPEVLR